MGYNKGDTIVVNLTYTLDGNPIQQGDLDEIEFTFGSKSYTITNNGVVWNAEEGCYQVVISQADSLVLESVVEYQTRFKKDGYVTSVDVQKAKLGKNLSGKSI